MYSFKHALIQEAAYQSLLKSRRQQYHERIARVIVDHFAGDAEAHPEVVALHHTQAGDIDAAVGWWQKAGQHAFRRASYAEAIAHYSNGLRALESLSDERRRAQSELALQVDLGYALIPLRGWGALETAQAFSRAGELCRQIGDTPSQFRALWGVGAFHFVRGDQHKALEVAEQCLDLARQADDEDALIEAHYLMGIVRCVRGDFVSGCSELEACIRLYGTRSAPHAPHPLRSGCQGLGAGLARDGAVGARASRRGGRHGERRPRVRARHAAAVPARTRIGRSWIRACLPPGAAGTGHGASGGVGGVRRAGVHVFPRGSLRVSGRESGAARQRARRHRADASEHTSASGRRVPGCS